MMAERNFTDKAALVIGAGRGIGRAFALRLAQAGANTLCVARTLSQIEETVTDAGHRASALAVDISAPNASEAIMAATRSRLGRLDMLILSASIMHEGTIENCRPQDVERLFAVNVHAPLRVVQAALPALRTSQGQILFVNSTIIQASNTAGRGLYAAGQAALKAVADSLRDEVNADQIRVMSIMPGTTATPRAEAMFANSGRAYRPDLLLQPDDVAQIGCDALLSSRTAEVTDLFIRPMQKG